MATLFTKIIDGELPGRFIWQDTRCVAFLSIAPLAYGHTLVVPRQEIDRWTDADAELLGRRAHRVRREVAGGLHESRVARLGEAVAEVGVGRQRLLLEVGLALDGGDYVRDQVGAALVLVQHL